MIYNELIAHFMGGSIIKTEHYEMPHGSHQSGVINYWSIPRGITSCNQSMAKIGMFFYHNDWNDLNFVINYIETFGEYRFVICGNICIIEIKHLHKWEILLTCEDKNKLTATYNAVGKLLQILKNK